MALFCLWLTRVLIFSHCFDQVGQSTQGDTLTQRGTVVAARIPEPSCPGRHIVKEDAGLPTNTSTVSNGDVVRDTDLPAHDHTVAQYDAPRQPHLSRQDTVPTDPAVMSDLAEVINLRPLADRCG